MGRAYEVSFAIALAWGRYSLPFASFHLLEHLAHHLPDALMQSSYEAVALTTHGVSAFGLYFCFLRRSYDPLQESFELRSVHNVHGVTVRYRCLGRVEQPRYQLRLPTSSKHSHRDVYSYDYDYHVETSQVPCTSARSILSIFSSVKNEQSHDLPIHTGGHLLKMAYLLGRRS